MNVNKHLVLTTGIILAILGVMLGAFGAHALKEVLAASNSRETYETAVRYQFYHAFAILATGILMHFYSSKSLQYAFVSFLLGIILFSGSLYLFCLAGVSPAVVTPLGGLLFMVGWICLLTGINKKESQS